MAGEVESPRAKAFRTGLFWGKNKSLEVVWMGKYFIRISTIYLILGLLIGYLMGVTNLFQYTSLHVHVNFVGWVTSALFGVVYCIFSSPRHAKMIKVHFWLHTLGVPLLVGGMYLIIAGMEAIGGPLSGLGGALVIVGAVLFSMYSFKAFQPSKE
ncbi:cytochrome-c oxidase [Brevibacillus agri]|uniref:cytochrome-c oxidase n=1 Tax=Brevibacillus agri TaxID=51101 RepID=UPI0012DEF3CF|nr:cytochrome-c oxidase [Brevibacillus agri]